ncbi:ribosome biogenesis GTP-binding protein YihA/YsxC [Patescibacteria group bacterium]|nr:ribosome biogenesis GTP-binding protein YihA/YsxC [Patescibacteria group bacterium]MBU4057689.1 ribosome biogenesis GTP-binding protein YihA/YsxC [Patescibacteria group bacterium]MBU4115812.1 ribosome biogenesis GTP-binding protein YihA/YsxC [Patescibacteria group bacterium]
MENKNKNSNPSSRAKLATGQVIKIISSTFVRGFIGENKIFFDGKEQIAFIGRSNVGKSSVINTLVSKKNLAKSSSLPGKTREINFFLINPVRNRTHNVSTISNGVYFVDLPGYGYAKMLPKLANRLRKRIIWYFSELKIKPKYVVLIIDSRIGITVIDKEMLEILENENHNVLVLANKLDKLSQSELVKNIKKIKDDLKNYKCVKNIILFSTKTKKGREELLNLII